MIVVIDNYDSFTYNLVQYLGEMRSPAYGGPGQAAFEVRVFRNDAVEVQAIEALHPSHVVISPGPGDPSDAGISSEVIRQLGPKIPTLGVCLGHQCIGEVFGGKVERAPRLMHGKTSEIFHYADGLFVGLPNPFQATRYHSLIVRTPLPGELEVTAFTSEGELMGLRHRSYPIYGVQFHPESILTPQGRQILRNFVAIRSTGGGSTGWQAAQAQAA